MNNSTLGGDIAHSSALNFGMEPIRYQRFAVYCIDT